MNYKIIALSIASVLLLNGCGAMQKASTAMGSETTGALVGIATGVGTGVACDKLTGGKNTGACVAAGLAVGAAAGAMAASWDEGKANSIQGMDCATIKRRMNYSSTENKPKAELRFKSGQSSRVVKLGQKPPIEVYLATPEKADKDQFVVPLKIAQTHGTETSNYPTPLKWTCGGYELPWIKTEKEGVYFIQLSDGSDGQRIDDPQKPFCYTVANNGVDKCGGMDSAAADAESFTKPSKRSKHRRRR